MPWRNKLAVPLNKDTVLKRVSRGDLASSVRHIVWALLSVRAVLLVKRLLMWCGDGLPAVAHEKYCQQVEWGRQAGRGLGEAPLRRTSRTVCMGQTTEKARRTLIGGQFVWLGSTVVTVDGWTCKT